MNTMKYTWASFAEGATESEVDDGKEFDESDCEEYETDSLNNLSYETDKSHERFVRSSSKISYAICFVVHWMFV